MYGTKMLLFFFLVFGQISLATSKENTFKKFPNKYFVETGSNAGGGIEKALKAGFEYIYSIELSEYYYALCKKCFAYNEKVVLFLGDSGVIKNDLKTPRLFKPGDERSSFV